MAELGKPSTGQKYKISVAISTDTYQNIAGQREATLNLEAGEIDASHKESDGWSDTIPGLRTWGIDATAVIMANDTAADALMEKFIEGEPIAVKYTRKDGVVWSGDCAILSLSENSPHNDVATYTIKLKGLGKPTRTKPEVSA